MKDRFVELTLCQGMLFLEFNVRLSWLATADLARILFSGEYCPEIVGNEVGRKVLRFGSRPLSLDVEMGIALVRESMLL